MDALEKYHKLLLAGAGDHFAGKINAVLLRKQLFVRKHGEFPVADYLRDTGGGVYEIIGGDPTAGAEAKKILVF